MRRVSTLTNMLRGLGDVPAADYAPPYAGIIFAPNQGNGPLGAASDPPLVSGDGTVVLKGTTEKNRARFLDWLRTYNPGLFRAAVKHAESWKEGVKAAGGAPTALSGVALGDTSSSDWWTQLTQGITSMGTAYLAYEGQKNIIALNTQRAQVGLPPLDPTTGAPTVNTTVGLSPQLMARLQSGGSWLIIGAVGIAALMVLKSALGGKRR
jgi:hypothetical protein